MNAKEPQPKPEGMARPTAPPPPPKVTRTTYVGAVEFMQCAVMSMCPGLLIEAVRACVRTGCFKSDEAMIRSIRTYIQKARAEFDES